MVFRVSVLHDIVCSWEVYRRFVCSLKFNSLAYFHCATLRMANNHRSVMLSLHLLNSVLICSPSLEIKNALRVASDLNSPRFLTKSVDNGRFTLYKGFVKDFIEELVNILGYDYEIILPSEYRANNVPSSTNTSSGYRDGVIGMLIRNEVDLAFGGTEVTSKRAQVVDFSAPVLNARFSILHNLQHYSNQSCIATSPIWTIFLPFPVPVWISFIVITLLYLGFQKIDKTATAASCQWLAVRRMHKLKYAKKFATIIFSLWTLLLFTSYISNYTAQKVLTTVSSKHQRLQNLADLATHKQIKLGWLARGSVEEFFRNTANKFYQKVYMTNVGRDWLLSVQDGVAKVLQEDGEFAFIVDSLTAAHEVLSDCSLYTLPQKFGPEMGFAVATPIGSHLRERVNHAVLSLTEQGIVEAIYQRWFVSSVSSCPPLSHPHHTAPNILGKTTTNASMQEVSPIFIFAVIGLFLSTVVGVVEMQLLRKKSTTPLTKPPRQQSELLPKFNLEVV